MNKLLIVEDDREINRLLCGYLSGQGYATVSAANGLEALSAVREHSDLSLMILDLMLPFKSGDAVLKSVREFSQVPVIIVSAKDTVQTKIDTIRMGADDYVTKPFDLDELLARIEAVLKRCGGSAQSMPERLRFRALTLEPSSKTATVNGHALVLTAKEYAILELLLSHPAKLFSKANLFESVWQETYYSGDSTLKVHMSNLRNKIREYDPDGEYIETVWGMGYKLKSEEDI